MPFTLDEVIETLSAVGVETFDIRTITLGISLDSCADEDVNRCAMKIYDKVTNVARNLVPTARQIEKKYGIPIVNKRILASGENNGDTIRNDE